jgi:hypothetical protein
MQDAPLVLASSAAKVLDIIERSFERVIPALRHYDLLESVDKFASGEKTRLQRIRGAAHLSEDAIGGLHQYPIDLAIRKLWLSNGRTVYSIHPAMVTELVSSKSDRLPGQVFEFLPHRCPLVIFPQPIPTTMPNGTAGEILGFYVYGRFDDKTRLCPTHDDRLEMLGLDFISRVELLPEEKLNSPHDSYTIDYTRVSIPVSQEEFTVEEAVATTLSVFWPDSTTPRDKRLQEWIENSIRLALNVLLYVCSEEPDIVPTQNKRAIGKTKEGKPVRQMNVGWTVGPALLKAREHHESQPGIPTGRKMAPHQRRAHFHTYWTGPGRTVPIIRWLNPIFVNVKLADESAPAKIVPVNLKEKAAAK